MKRPKWHVHHNDCHRVFIIPYGPPSPIASRRRMPSWRRRGGSARWQPWRRQWPGIGTSQNPTPLALPPSVNGMFFRCFYFYLCDEGEGPKSYISRAVESHFVFSRGSSFHRVHILRFSCYN